MLGQYFQVLFRLSAELSVKYWRGGKRSRGQCSSGLSFGGYWGVLFGNQPLVLSPAPAPNLREAGFHFGFLLSSLRLK